MQKLKLLVLLSGIFLAVLESSASATQSKQPVPTTINLESLLSDAGYKPIKVRDGMWGVSGLSYQGQNLKKLDTFLEVNPSNGLLRITARIGFHDHLDENADLKKILDSLKERLKPTEFSLSKQSLFAVVEFPADKLDRVQLVQAIEKAAGEADKAYPDLAKFIIKAPAVPSGAPSLGPGTGEGFGTGQGGGVGPANSGNAGSNSSSSGTSGGTKVDSMPVIIDKGPPPAYTDEARKNRVQGSVLIRIVVDETGAPTKIRISRGLPDGLDQQAIEKVLKMKFRPAMKDGKPVSFPMLVEINFYL